jgi:hypothetical protein
MQERAYSLGPDGTALGHQSKASTEYTEQKCIGAVVRTEIQVFDPTPDPDSWRTNRLRNFLDLGG